MRIGQRVVVVQTSAGKLRWRIDSLTSQTHLLGSYEIDTQAFRRFLKNGSVVYDIGAHVGFFSLYCGLLVAPDGRVIAFEPDPAARASLQRQVAENPGLKVEVLPYAISDHSGTLLLDTSCGSSQAFVSENGSVSVAAETIDLLVQQQRIAPPTLLKIDVEGHEYAALETIRCCHPVVLCDYNEGDTLGTVRRLLSPLGYEIDARRAPIVAVPPCSAEVR
jgi:FkbM family methyltransferase